jgi:threonine aldolase
MANKISFRNDYSEGAHPKILEKLSATNYEQQPGYGDDKYCEQAKVLIHKHLANPAAKIYFTSGGTQANLLVISHLLKPYETVICANTGHIEVHETGAIEATGHKVTTLPSTNGKISVDELEKTLSLYTDHHMVKPAMVYISNATELGSIYTRQELTALSNFCRKNNLLLFMDGARLAMGLTANVHDVTLADIAKLVDVFYIGGTKNGALIGEAIVFTKDGLDNGFEYSLKQRGALLAKGRLLGIQFLSLFENGLYFELATHANKMAQRIAETFQTLGLDFYLPPVTNQIFPILPTSLIEELNKKFEFYVWHKVDDDQSAIRIVTSWATKEEAVDQFISYVTKLVGQ